MVDTGDHLLLSQNDGLARTSPTEQKLWEEEATGEFACEHILVTLADNLSVISQN